MGGQLRLPDTTLEPGVVSAVGDSTIRFGVARSRFSGLAALLDAECACAPLLLDPPALVAELRFWTAS